MAAKFRPGAVAYTENGRRFTIEEVTDGTAYCVGENGAEAEYAEKALLTEAEWMARNETRGVNVYSRIKQSWLFTAPAARFEREAAKTLLARVDKLIPGILDFIAFTMACRVLAEAGEAERASALSITKCRAVFDEVSPEIRAGLLTTMVAAPPDALVNAARLGDNLMRALVEKGMAPHATAFEEFCDRPRN